MTGPGTLGENSPRRTPPRPAGAGRAARRYVRFRDLRADDLPWGDDRTARHADPAAAHRPGLDPARAGRARLRPGLPGEGRDRQPPPSEEMLAYLAGRLGLTVDELRFGRPPGIAAQLRAALDEGYRDLEQGRAAVAEARFTAVGAAGRGLPPRRRRVLRAVLPGRGEVAAPRRRGRANGAGARRGAGRRGAAVAAGDDRAPLVGLPVPEGDAGAAIARVEEALGVLEGDPDAELCLLSALIHPLMEMGGLHRAQRAALAGLRLMRSATRPDFVARFHRQASQVWQAIGECERAEQDLIEASRLFASVGFDRDAARCRWAHGYLLRRLGRLEEARAELTEARDQLAAIGSRRASRARRSSWPRSASAKAPSPRLRRWSTRCCRCSPRTSKP